MNRENKTNKFYYKYLLYIHIQNHKKCKILTLFVTALYYKLKYPKNTRGGGGAKRVEGVFGEEDGGRLIHFNRGGGVYNFTIF